MATRASDMRSKNIENLIHKVLDPSWRLADRDNRAISKLSSMFKKLLDRAYTEGMEEVETRDPGGYGHPSR